MTILSVAIALFHVTAESPLLTTALVVTHHPSAEIAEQDVSVLKVQGVDGITAKAPCILTSEFPIPGRIVSP